MKYEDIPICIFNSNNGDRIIGFQCENIYQSSRFNQNEIEQFLSNNSENYVFTALSFDLKNPLLGLSSRHEDQQNFPLISFWVPKNVVRLTSEGFEFLRGNQSSETIAFLDWLVEMETNENYHTHSIELKASTSKENYLTNISKIKAHLQRGDIYEMNYCQEFFAENVEISNPLDLYFKLNQNTKAPFSAYLQLNEHLLFCTSPERFIQKKGTNLLSQPIKG
ncbi:MAG: chorismate-binding protein, partial [Crocinitomicaceae bacterium]